MTTRQRIYNLRAEVAAMLQRASVPIPMSREVMRCNRKEDARRLTARGNRNARTKPKDQTLNKP